MMKKKMEYRVAAAWLMIVAMLAAGCSDADSGVMEPDNANDGQAQEQPKEITLEEMTLEEKVAQMFIITPELLSASSPCTEVDAQMGASLDACPVGGFILFAANIKNPEQTKRFIDAINEHCKYPPFIAVDEEGGAVARVANNSSFGVTKFPAMLEIGRTGDTKKAYNVGCTIGGYLNDYGFNLNFAPVADIFSNPANKVIGSRAFGTTAEAVSPMVGACIDGLHREGVFATMKHFPGHGDTDTDSHTSLPVVTKSWSDLLESEIIPFRDNMAKADMIMTAHIAVVGVNEEIDGRTAPSTLSYNMLTLKLRGELGYQGIIITDALRMAGITTFYPTQGEAAVQAIKAGVDIILCPGDFMQDSGAYNVVLKAVRSGEIPEERINQSVRRIIGLKNRM